MVLYVKIYTVVFHLGLKTGFLYYEGYRESMIPVTAPARYTKMFQQFMLI
jgi:hypothetical protein